MDEAEAKLRAREADETGIRRLTESVQRSEERFRTLARRRAEPPAVPRYRVAHRVRQRRVSRGGRLVDKTSRRPATSPTSWASSASWSGNRITSALSRARPSATTRRARPAMKAASFTSRIGRASTSRAKCAAFSRWPRISRSGARFELELEAKQAELLRSNKDLEQFAYVASHDLKAPLRAIELLVQWIVEGLAGYDANNVQENLALLGKRTQRLNRLLDDLLAYSRAGRKVGAHRVADTHALVLDMVQMLNPPPTIAISIDGQATEVQDLSGAARAGVPQPHQQRGQAPPGAGGPHRRLLQGAGRPLCLCHRGRRRGHTRRNMRSAYSRCSRR